MPKARSLISKGRSFQKKVMELFKESFKLSDDDIRTAIGAETGEDIKLSKKARQIVGLSIECKNQKAISIWAALEQAKKNAVCEGVCPALIFHRSCQGNKDIWITVPLQHYLDVRANGDL